MLLLVVLGAIWGEKKCAANYKCTGWGSGVWHDFSSRVKLGLVLNSIYVAAYERVGTPGLNLTILASTKGIVIVIEIRETKFSQPVLKITQLFKS